MLLLGWPKRSFGFSHKMAHERLNELSGQPNTSFSYDQPHPWPTRWPQATWKILHKLQTTERAQGLPTCWTRKSTPLQGSSGPLRQVAPPSRVPPPAPCALHAGFWASGKGGLGPLLLSPWAGRCGASRFGSATFRRWEASPPSLSRQLFSSCHLPS